MGRNGEEEEWWKDEWGGDGVGRRRWRKMMVDILSNILTAIEVSC